MGYCLSVVYLTSLLFFPINYFFFFFGERAKIKSSSHLTASVKLLIKLLIQLQKNSRKRANNLEKKL